MCVNGQAKRARVCVGVSKGCVCVGGRARQARPAGLETQSVHSTLDWLVIKITVIMDKMLQ